jgi:hypothetical protein
MGPSGTEAPIRPALAEEDEAEGKPLLCQLTR